MIHKRMKTCETLVKVGLAPRRDLAGTAGLGGTLIRPLPKGEGISLAHAPEDTAHQAEST